MSTGMILSVFPGIDLSPFTVAGKIAAVGNGVPMPLGRAIACAVLEAIR